MNATEIAAWWGAIVASLVFLWDIYKWNRRGPDVSLSISTNMLRPGEEPEAKYVVVEVVNSGATPTTITHLIAKHYPSALARFRRKPDKQFIVANPGLGQPIPHLLEPGARWLGAITQTPELEGLSRNGHLLCGIHHTSSKRFISRRVLVR